MARTFEFVSYWELALVAMLFVCAACLLVLRLWIMDTTGAMRPMLQKHCQRLVGGLVLAMLLSYGLHLAVPSSGLYVRIIGPVEGGWIIVAIIAALIGEFALGIYRKRATFA